MITLHTDRLYIRDPLPGDLAGWIRLFTDAQNLHFVPYLVADGSDAVREKAEGCTWTRQQDAGSDSVLPHGGG